jgi:hypothetical protein
MQASHSAFLWRLSGSGSTELAEVFALPGKDTRETRMLPCWSRHQPGMRGARRSLAERDLVVKYRTERRMEGEMLANPGRCKQRPPDVR